MMRRSELAGAIATAIRGRDVVVVCSLGSTSRAWRDAGAANPTFFGSDPMGLAASVALGLAVARAPRPVLFLAGDGDLLMSATSLVAMAGVADVALGVVVFSNGRYETGGGQPLPGGGRTDLAGLAAGAGVRVLPPVATAPEVGPRIDALFADRGASLTVAAVAPEASPYGGPGDHSGAEEREHFRRSLARHDAVHATTTGQGPMEEDR